jgi:two-component system, NarL family, nitrate/nitrite sensor histidine kinase NarX
MNERELLQARWATFAALSLIVGFFLWAVAKWNLLPSGLVAIATAVTFSVVAEFWLRFALRQATGGQQIADTLFKLNQERMRTRSALNLQRKFLEARSEKEILEYTLQIGAESLRAVGASFVPFDEWGQSLPALTHGKVPGTALQYWAKRLSQPETRKECKNCKLHQSGPGCVMLPNEIAEPFIVRCYPLKSNENEVGMVNFYFDHDTRPEIEANDFFVESLAVAGVALENLRSRDQEIAALLYLQSETSTKSDLSILLDNLLENIQRALDVDFALLYIPGGIPRQINPAPQLFMRAKGDSGAASSAPDQPFLEGIWKSVLTSGQSLSLENATLTKQDRWKALLAVPLVWRGEEPLGVLVLGSNSAQAFAQRHQALLETLAGQAALLIQNARLMVQVEYQAVVDERTRLAREIHDGLAQTLAFLKIQASQMQNYLARGDMERLTSSLQASYRTLSDAYIDARQAIDNLRRIPANSPNGWIKQVAADFEQSTGIKVDSSAFEVPTEYPVNIQAQLIRIVQEALSNVRKHAEAQTVAIVGCQDRNSVLIEVRDDGRGFTPESVDGKSHYGLVGMRERAESIGADFQITSQPGNGTVVSLRLPVPVKEEL